LTAKCTELKSKDKEIAELKAQLEKHDARPKYSTVSEILDDSLRETTSKVALAKREEAEKKAELMKKQRIVTELNNKLIKLRQQDDPRFVIYGTR
jgi:hypothetical protein